MHARPGSRRAQSASCAGRFGTNGASGVTGSMISVPSLRRSICMAADGK
jgi:hypothetical protein